MVRVPGGLAVLMACVVAAACGLTIAENRDDATLAARVRIALLNDPDLGRLRLQARAVAGVVTLSGTVPSAELASRAANVAGTVRGVREVRSALEIGRAPEPGTPPYMPMAWKPAST